MRKAWRKKWVAGILCTSLVTGLLPVHGMERNVAEAETVQEVQEFAVVQNAGSEEKKIQNIIYMIPDGGGYPSYDIAKAVKEKGGLTYCNNKGTKQTANKMYLDDYLAGSIKTKSADNDTTDSAAAGTALAAGEKTNNGYIGVDASGKPVASIAELAQMEGKATGLISTSYAYDATPAAFAAHHMSRGGYDTIIQQMLYTDLDVVISAGMMYEGYTKQDNAGTIRKQGYTLADSESQLKKAAQTAKEGTKVWGNFLQSSHHIPFDIGYGISYDGINDEAKQTPTLAEMTDCAIKILSKDSDGFFLMVEGSKIDYGNHHGKMTESVGEWIAFDEAFGVALDYAKEHQDTAIVVAPDHNTGLKSTPGKMSSVVSMVQNGNNPGSDLLKFSASKSEYPHTGADVGVYIYVPEGYKKPAGLSEQNITKASERSKFVIDNTELAPYMASLISNKTLTDITNELYIDVTEKGTYSNNKFSFKNKNASVTINTDQAENNGKKIDLNGQIAVYCNKHCYVPKSLTDNLEIKVDIPGKHDLKGTGTKSDPYLIANEDNFLTFTNQILAGNAYKGKYIKQTADIDMSQITDYVGIYGKDKILFEGTYDGQGHTINVDISTGNTAGFSIFPYTTGMIRNLGTTGSMKNTADTGGCSGIVRSIRDGGSIVNCWSTVELTARYEVAAIAFSVRGNRCYL